MKMGTDQRGMTLVETLLAAGIATMIAGVLGSCVFLFMRVTEQGNDQLRAQHDVQNTGYWLAWDGERAETTAVDGYAGDMTLILDWTDDGQDHTVTYYRSGTGGINLQRDDDNGTVITGKIVARYVSSVDFSISNGLITATITCSPGGRWEASKTETYKIWPRPTV